jgi:hypothetical protein
MRKAPMVSRHMWAIVCDDLRPELGNKVSFMGVYGSEIVLTSFPAALPKLCAAVYVRTAKVDPFQKLIVRVLKDETEIGRWEMAEEQLRTFGTPEFPREEEGIIDAALMCQFAPLVLEQPCLLRFRAETEREILKGGSVRVRTADGAIAIGTD